MTETKRPKMKMPMGRSQLGLIFSEVSAHGEE
jgi:hypothetical protein